MSGPMEGILESKPPIVQSIRDAHDLPDVKVRGTGRLHAISASARHCRLPGRLIHEEDQDCYGKKAKEFITANDFHKLDNQTVTKPDPSLKFHYTEADCARSIEAHINDPVAKTLDAGYNLVEGTFAMISKTQNSTTVAITAAERIEKDADKPGQLTLIPDWIADCKLVQHDADGKVLSQKQSTLVMEYKNRNLLPCEAFEKEALLGDNEAYLEAPTLPSEESILVGEDLPISTSGSLYEYFASTCEEDDGYPDQASEEVVEELEETSRETSADAPEGAFVEPPQQSVLGLQPPSRFKKVVQTCMGQAGSYAQLHLARRVIMSCWNMQITFHFRDMDMKKTAIEQLRAGPGFTCSIVIKRNLNEFPREVLGA
ncbi:hypothetical protein QIS74_09797 [Colletotrichum tabaci]|uniref:BRCT domain-containing protein n=1 Tax=Colletotrichum tabaci TaxID=1209068 RepID=A0AAV9T5C8_9PEZI